MMAVENVGNEYSNCGSDSSGPWPEEDAKGCGDEHLRPEPNPKDRHGENGP